MADLKSLKKAAASTGERTVLREHQSGQNFRDGVQRRQAERQGISKQEINNIKQAPARQERAAEAAQQAVQADFSALASGEPEKVQDWKTIAEVAIQVGQSDSPEDQDVKNALLWQYGEQLRPHIDVAGGEEWWEQNYTEPPKEEKGILGTVMGGLSPIMKYIDQFSQEGLGALAGIEAAIDTDDEVSVGDGLRHAVRRGFSAVDPTKLLPGDKALSSVFEGDARTIATSDGRLLSTDRDQSGDTNFREALGLDPHGGGRVAGAFDLLGTIIVDPTTYLTLGGNQLAKLGLRGAEEVAEGLIRQGLKEGSAAAVPAIVQSVKRGGLKSLTEQEDKILRTMVELSVRRSSGELTEEAMQKAFQTQMQAISHGGRQGVHLAGVTVIPTARLTDRLRKLGIASQTIFERGPRTSDEISEVGEQMLEDGSVIPLADEVVDGDFDPGWRVYEAPEAQGTDILNVTGKDGSITQMPRSEMENVLSFMSDLEVALLARTSADILELVPRSRLKIIRALTTDAELWEDGFEGVVRRMAGDGYQQRIPFGGRGASRLDEIAPRKPEVETPEVGPGRPTYHAEPILPFEGTLPKQDGPARLADPQPGSATTPLSGSMGERLPVPYKATSTDIVPYIAPELQTKADDLLEAVGDTADEALDPAIRQQFDDLGYEIISQSFKEGWWGKMMDLPVIGSIVSRMSTRAYIRARHGQAAADAWGHLKSITGDTPALRDVQVRLGIDMHKGDVYKLAIEDSGGVERLNRKLDEALTTPERYDEILQELGPKGQQLLETLNDVRTEIYEATLRGMGYTHDEIALMTAGKMDLPTTLHDLNKYVPRVLSAAARNDGEMLDAIRNLGGKSDPNSLLPQRASTESLGEQALKERTVSAESVFGANEELASMLREAGVDSVNDMFETNLPLAFGARAESAFRAMADVDLLEGTTRLTGANGYPLGVRLSSDEIAAAAKNKVPVSNSHLLKSKLPPGAKASDYVEIATPSGAVFMVDKTVAKEMENVRRVLGDPKELKKGLDLYDAANNIWAMSATVGLINPGFHIRNGVGNVFNMVLGGVRNPKVFGEAASLQRTNSRIMNRMGETGADYAQAAKDLDIPQADVNILTSARQNGVLNDGRALDLSRKTSGEATSSMTDPTQRSLVSRINPADANSVLNRGGVVAGEAIENNARLAMYLDQINKGASETVATQHVKKYLFDYSDLTRFEGETLRRASRFYCVPTDHRALTREGYKTYDQLVPGETEMLVFDPDTHETGWEVLQDVAVFDHDAQINVKSWHGREVAFTDGHRWPVVNERTGARGIVEHEFMSTELRSPTNSEAHRYDTTEAFGPRLAAILGWLVGDGHEAQYQWFIYQKKQPYLDDIRALIPGAAESVHPASGVTRLSVPRGIRDDLRQRGYTGKDSLPALVTRFSAVEAEAFMTALLHAEGTLKDGTWSFSQKEGPVMDAFQILAFTCGWRAWTVPATGDDMLAVNLSPQNRTRMTQDVKKRRHTGQVWCPQTPTGTWVVEHDGVVLPTGNTFTRKNTALQAHVLARHPGLAVNAQQILDAAVGGTMGELQDEDGRAPSWMQGASLGSVAGADAALDIDTPFNSFEDMVGLLEPLYTEPDPLDPKQTRWSRMASNLDSLFGGVGVSALDFHEENQTGVDSFSGRPLTPPGTIRDGEDVGEVRDSGMFRAIEVLFPAAARAERWGAQTGVGGVRGGRDERDMWLNALNILGGLQVAELDGDSSDAARNSLIYTLQDHLTDMRNRYGVYDADSNPGGVRSLTDMRKAGEISSKDQLMEAMMYSWSEGPDGELVWDDKLRDQRLQNLVPKDVLEAMGVEFNTEEHDFTGSPTRPELAEDDAEGRAKRDEEDLASAIRAYEAWRGEPLTDEQKLTFLVASPWAPSNTMLENLGIEPFRGSNRFTNDGEEEQSFASEVAEGRAALDRLASAVGLDPETVSRLRPRLSEFQRILNEADAAGVSDADLQQYIVMATDEGGGGVLSRNDKAFINQLLGYERDDGPVPLTTTRRPELSQEDLLKIQTKAWEAQEEYVLFSRMFGLPAPSQDMIQTYVMNSIMTSGTLEHMGYDDLKGAPSREDIRTEAEKLQASQDVNQAGILGLTQGPYRG